MNKQNAKMKVRIKKDDTVMVVAGKDKGKTGRVIHIDRKNGRVIVEKCNMVKKTQRPTQNQQKGGIIEIEAPLHISNVMLVDPKSGAPTRIGYKFEDGQKVRYAKKSGKTL